MARKITDHRSQTTASHPLFLFGQYDPWIFTSVTLLVIMGIVMVLNTSYFYSSEYFASPYHFLGKHLIAASIGIAGLGAAACLPSSFYHRLAYPTLGLAIILLLVVLFLPSYGKASRWIRLGSMSFQPSELTKWAVILYLARSLSQRAGIGEQGFFVPILTVGLAIGLVGIEPDFGTAAFIGLILLAMLLAAGARWSHLVGLVLIGVAVLACGILAASYRMDRIDAFLNPWLHRQGKGFQIIQSFLAFGSGGLTGVGLGAGQQKMFYLPEARTDFIFAVIGEELGLWGTSLVLFLFLLLGQRGLRIALRHPSLFGRLLALGLTLLLVWQAGINMAVVTGLVPTKGISLPLVSYGGSGLVIAMLSAGVLLALSRETGRKKVVSP
jgi:cell division protein FtsW